MLQIQDTVGSSFSFLIHSDNLCLLIEEFNPFIFDAITDRVGFISSVLLYVF